MDLIKKQFLEWHSGIEKKIPCHFCSVKLSEEIYSCDLGHDVCHSCKTDSCIACKKSSPFFRNHIAEFLISQLNTLKNDVELLDESIITPIKPKLKCKFSQTKAEKNLVVETVKESAESKSAIVEKSSKESIENKTVNIENSIEYKSVEVKKSLGEEPKINDNKSNDNPSNTYGIFSCWIGRDCHLKGDHSAILAHMKNQHADVFVTHKKPFRGWPFVISWDLNYNGANSREDRAFEIQGVGLFVLHIFVTNEQHLKAHVLMFDSGRTAAQYRYELEIKSDDKKKSFSSAVDSSRLPRKSLHDRSKGLFINENSMLQSAIKMKCRYQCTVQITKLNETTEKKTTEDSVSSEVENKTRKEQNLKPNGLTKKNFKPAKKNLHHFKDRSKPGLLDLKNIKIAYGDSQTPVQPPEPPQHNLFKPGVNSQPPHLYPNLQKEFNYQQVPQHPEMTNDHFNMNMQPMNVQPPPYYPGPPVFNEHYQRNSSPQNPFVDESQAFFPAQPTAPVFDVENSRNPFESNRPGNFTTAEKERQKLIQQEIEERERNRRIQSGATAFDATQDDKRKFKASSNFNQKKPNECVLC